MLKWEYRHDSTSTAGSYPAEATYAMTRIEHYDEEDRPLLVLALDSKKFRLSQPTCEAAVTRGAVNYLGRWPAHVLAAFIAGCLVFATFVLFGIIIAILSIPLDEKCRIPRDIESNYLPNVYFIKHENRTWNRQELCYIETTARTYDNLSIYLINLLDDNESSGNLSRLVIELLEMKDEEKGHTRPISVAISNEIDKSMMPRRESPERQSREKLAAFNGNIKNIDVPIRRFFNGSRLAGVCNHLSKDMIEMAARAYVLWNFPGVALDPEMYPNLEFLKEYLCKKVQIEKRCDKNDSIAAIELNGDIQASSVPCQAFLDYLIRQISLNELPDQQHALKKAIGDFCPRWSPCQGVRLLNSIPKTQISRENLNCPTIIPADGMDNITEKMQNASKAMNGMSTN